MPTKLRELQEKLWSRQDNMKRILEQARLSDGSYDFTKADAFEHLDSQKACIEQMEAMEREMDDTANEVKTLEGIQEQERRLKEKLEARRTIDTPMVHANGNAYQNGQNGQGIQQKSLSDWVREVYPRDAKAGGGLILDREFRQIDLKAIMTTTAGFAPEVTRIPRIQEFAHRPIQITDLFPVSNIDQPSVQWMEETTSTNAATEVAENLAGPYPTGGAGTFFPESSLQYTERTITIPKIATFLPVTDEQLADVNQIAGIIDARLRFFAMQRLDNQILNGTGTPPNMRGVINTAGVQTQARGADPIPDAIYKAMVKIRTVGRATPTAVIVNPVDWQTVRLLRTTDGAYLWGHPSIAGVETLFGVPVVIADVIAATNALVGDFANMAQLWTRQGVQVESGFINDFFVRGLQAVRVTLRAVVTVYRPQAFCSVTGL